ncbi:MAG: hypothetical protein ACRD8A_07290 [Candidatus Acidiferrales bacterium]
MMTARRIMFLYVAVTLFATVPSARAQSAAGLGSDTTSASQSAQPAPAQSSPVAAANLPGTPAVYHRPSEREKLRNFAFDTFGPYPILTAATAAGIQQAYGTPPEWGQGWGAYADRFGSNYGIQFITTSTRYALAEAFHEDTLYYRCSCTGFFPRLGHALLSTVTARHGEDGHYLFSLSALGSPYAGTMAATLGWYPSRYNAMDGFRMGTYNLAAAAGQNVALEFIYGGPHTMLGRFRILRSHTSSDPDNP